MPQELRRYLEETERDRTERDRAQQSDKEVSDEREQTTLSSQQAPHPVTKKTSMIRTATG